MARNDDSTVSNGINRRFGKPIATIHLGLAQPLPGGRATSGVALGIARFHPRFETDPVELRLLQDFIDTFSSQIAILDSEGQVVLANRAWTMRVDVAIALKDHRSPLLASLANNRREATIIVNSVARVLSGDILQADVNFSSVVGKVRKYFRLCAAPLERGMLRGVMIIIEDISTFHELASDKTVLLQQLMKSEDGERRRIAREMHDSTAQDLVAIGLNLQRMRLPDDAATQDALIEVKAILFRAQQDVRTMSYLLHPPELEEGGLAIALESLIDGLRRRMEFNIRLEQDGFIPPLKHEVELALYRVAQEGLINVHKHAWAECATVRLHRVNDEIVLDVEDNGGGFIDPTSRGQSQGVGIQSMRARLRLLGGKLRITHLGRGTRLRASVPFDVADRAVDPKPPLQLHEVVSGSVEGEVGGGSGSNLMHCG